MEDTKKYILIGIYTEVLIVKKLPTNLNLAFWVEMYFDQNGEVAIEVRILNNKKPVVGGQAAFSIKDHTKLIPVPFRDIPISIEAEGMLTFQMREKGGRWKTVKKIPLKLANK